MLKLKNLLKIFTTSAMIAFFCVISVRSALAYTWSDTFTNTNGTDLSTHNAKYVNFSGTAKIQSNTAYSTSASPPARYDLNDGGELTDYTTCVDVTHKTSVDANYYLHYGRMNGSRTNWYRFYIQGGTPTTITLGKAVATVESTLDTYNDTYANNETHTYCLIFDGTDISVTEDSVEILQATDSSHTRGWTHLYMGQFPIDNFTVDSVEPTPTPTPTATPTPTPTNTPTPTSGPTPTPQPTTELESSEPANFEQIDEEPSNRFEMSCLDNSEYADGDIYLLGDKPYKLGRVHEVTFNLEVDSSSPYEVFLTSGNANLFSLGTFLATDGFEPISITKSNFALGGFFTAQRLHFENDTCDWGIAIVPTSGTAKARNGTFETKHWGHGGSGSPESNRNGFDIVGLWFGFLSFFNIANTDLSPVGDFMFDLEQKSPFAYIFALLDLNFNDNLEESDAPVIEWAMLGFTTFEWVAPEAVTTATGAIRTTLRIMVWAFLVIYLVLLSRRLTHQ